MKLNLFTLLLLASFLCFHLKAQQNHQVGVFNNFFDPQDLSITAGDTVTWVKDGGFHNVNGSLDTYPNNPEGFRNGEAASPPFTFQHIFTIPGLYEYQCDPHISLGMMGTITVMPNSNTNSDIVITEIMYNSPASDDFEFIELYNKGTTNIDLTAWSFTQGITYTFGATQLEAGNYLVVSEDSLLMLELYGMNGFEWTSGGLSNGGEDIVLVDANGTVVDSVDYDDGNGWTATADGEGPSLVLCDVEADNAGPENWERAITYAGFMENCKEVYANPGSTSNCASLPVLSFQLSCFEVNEDRGLVFVNVLIDNPRDITTQVQVLLNEEMSTASNGEDFDFNAPATIVFPEGTDTAQTFVFQIIDDNIMNEGDETIVLNLHSDTDDVVLATTTLNITISDNDIVLTNALILTGVYDGPLTGGVPKGVEIYALQDIANLSNFGLGSANNGGGSDGQEYSFPAVAVSAGTHLYITNDSAGFHNYFGFFNENVFIDSGTAVNINGDDAVELFESNQVIDVFGDINVDGSDTDWEYLDSWAYRKSGTGPDGSTFIADNWLFGGVNNFDNTTTNADAPNPLPIGTYSPTLGEVAVANDDAGNTDFNTSLDLNVLSNDILPNAVTSVNIVENGSIGIATVNADNSITYAPNMDECGSDSFTYEVCDANACDTATVSITVACPISYPAYDIATVTTENAEGAADSLDVTCSLQGIVHGIDFRGGTGVQFTIIDPTAGIAVFDFDIDYYDVTEGDEVMVQGSIQQFRGLTQINADTIIVVSAGNALQTPNIVTALDESTESQLVKIENLTLVDPAEWINDGTGFNVTLTDGSNTYSMRIDNDTDIFGTPAPNFTFHLTGIGSQFDNGDAPFTDGYQIYPRYLNDIEMITAISNPLETGLIQWYPNPVNDQLHIQAKIGLEKILLINVLGQTIKTINKPSFAEKVTLKDLDSGIYWMSFIQEGKNWTTKIVKK